MFSAPLGSVYQAGSSSCRASPTCACGPTRPWIGSSAGSSRHPFRGVRVRGGTVAIRGQRSP